MAGNSMDAGRSVTSKITAIIMAFSHGEAYSLTEIARLTGLPLATAHRLATELVELDMLQRTSEGQFRVGVQLRVIAHHAVPVAPKLLERARRVMEDLAAAAGRGVVRLGVLQDFRVSYIEKGPGAGVPTAFDTATLPVHATAMGRALLAFTPPRLVDQVIDRGLTPYTPYTTTAPDRFRRALSVIRLTQVAVCRREYEPHHCTAAVPVFGWGGRVVAALEVSIRDGRDLRLMRPPLIMAGRALTRELQSGTSRPARTIGADNQFDMLVARRLW